MYLPLCLSLSLYLLLLCPLLSSIVGNYSTGEEAERENPLLAVETYLPVAVELALFLPPSQGVLHLLQGVAVFFALPQLLMAYASIFPLRKRNLQQFMHAVHKGVILSSVAYWLPCLRPALVEFRYALPSRVRRAAWLRCRFCPLLTCLIFSRRRGSGACFLRESLLNESACRRVFFVYRF